jgi:hypothetical protein
VTTPIWACNRGWRPPNDMHSRPLGVNLERDVGRVEYLPATLAEVADHLQDDGPRDIYPQRPVVVKGY